MFFYDSVLACSLVELPWLWCENLFLLPHRNFPSNAVTAVFCTLIDLLSFRNVPIFTMFFYWHQMKKYLWKNIKIFYILSKSLSFSFSMMVFLFDLVLQITSVHSCVTRPVFTIHCCYSFFLLLLNDSLPPLFLYSFKSFQGLLTYFQIKSSFLLLGQQCHLSL